MPLDRHGFLMTQQMGQISQPHRQVVDRYPCKGWALLIWGHSNAYFYVPDDVAFDWDSNFTIGFWFKPFGWFAPAPVENRYLVACSPNVTPGWGLHIKHNWGTYSLEARVWESAGLATSTILSPLVLGERYCVLFTCAEVAGDVVLRTFLGDGHGHILTDLSLTFSTATLAAESPGTHLYLGRQMDLVTPTVDVDMDEVHIWTSDVYAAIKTAWFNGGSGTRLEALGAPEAGYHCDWSVVDFTGNLHTLVSGPMGWFISPDLIHQPGCDINGVA